MKIQMRGFESSIPVGFFCYPISQAADITAFRATCVPVGEDQMPMIEQCREIVHSFNRIYGETLTDPKIMLPSNSACLRLPGTDGKAKMSKSLGNCIYLADDEKTVRTKIMSMFTDPDHIRIEDPGGSLRGRCPREGLLATYLKFRLSRTRFYKTIQKSRSRPRAAHGLQMNACEKRANVL